MLVTNKGVYEYGFGIDGLAGTTSWLPIGQRSGLLMTCNHHSVMYLRK